jgi:hypothetical protein
LALQHAEHEQPDDSGGGSLPHVTPSLACVDPRTVSVPGVRFTTSTKPHIASIVEIPSTEVLPGGR